MNTIKLGDSSEEVWSIQKFLKARGYPVIVDGDFGKKTQSAVKTYQKANKLKADGVIGKATLDKMISHGLIVDDQKDDKEPLPEKDDETQIIEGLNPKAQPYFFALSKLGKQIAIENGAGNYKIISGNRTYAEQTKLYNKGRKTSGDIVTYARAGYSNHNFGIAVDGGFFGKNGSYLDESNPSLAEKLHKKLAELVKIKIPQLEWGGDWEGFKDIPHWEIKTGLTMDQKRARIASGKPIL